ncbi:hypothetical protein QBC44DRAFT_322732 [Cladorrhinum sp. PSN332]|nr:hypothetical protein QBC44DRAFT_322732 [Cladorrhinum sp. PSN332]
MSRASFSSTGMDTPDTDTTWDDDKSTLERPWTQARRHKKEPKNSSSEDMRYKGSVPSPDKVFTITDADFNHALTLLNGELKFVQYNPENLEKAGCWLWHCAEKNGWLGFRNVASGTYLGHDGNGGLRAVQKHHKNWEQFCVRHDVQERGYVLLMGLWDKLARIGITGSGEEAKCRMSMDVEPMIWKFVEVSEGSFYKSW